MSRILDCVDILIIAPGYLGYLWMADKFCKRYLGVSRRNELLFVIFSFGGWLLLNIVGRRYSVPYILSVMPGQLLFMGLVLLLFQAGWEKKFLAASILMIVVTLVVNIFDPLLSCLALFFRHMIKKNPAPVLSEWEYGATGCVSVCMVILTVYEMTKYVASVFSEKRGKWYVMLAIPLLVIVAVFDMANWGASNGIMVRSGGNMGLYYDQIFSHAEFAILAVISMSAAGFYVFGMNRIYLEQEKSNQYYSQIAVYRMLAEQHRQSERLRHDMKNHIIALSALYRNKEWEKMGGYLKNMEDGCLEICGDMTGNKAVDALLYQKRKQAEEEEIRWECDVQIPKECCINEFDLCVLFGNLLDNALEACGRQQRGECRFIHIQAKTVKKCFLLEMKNSMGRAERYADGFTNKENPQEHGIGLLNVSDVVQGYNGVVNAEAGNGSFVISILIPFHDAAHDTQMAV